MKTVTIHRAEWMKLKEQAAQTDRLTRTLQVIANTEKYERDGADQTAELMRRIARGALVVAQP